MNKNQNRRNSLTERTISEMSFSTLGVYSLVSAALLFFLLLLGALFEIEPSNFFGFLFYLLLFVLFLSTVITAAAGFFHQLRSRRRKNSYLPSKQKPVRTNLPDLKNTRIPAEYAVRLQELYDISEEMQERRQSVSGLLSDFFHDSVISIDRYQSVMNDAAETLKRNYQKASEAVRLFGNSKVTPERIFMLDTYLNDSKDLMNKMERIIDELIRSQQTEVISDSDVLDPMLDSLAETTSLYRQNRRSDFDL